MSGFFGNFCLSFYGWFCRVDVVVSGISGFKLGISQSWTLGVEIQSLSCPSGLPQILFAIVVKCQVKFLSDSNGFKMVPPWVNLVILVLVVIQVSPDVWGTASLTMPKLKRACVDSKKTDANGRDSVSASNCRRYPSMPEGTKKHRGILPQAAASTSFWSLPTRKRAYSFCGTCQNHHP